MGVSFGIYKIVGVQEEKYRGCRKKLPILCDIKSFVQIMERKWP